MKFLTISLGLILAGCGANAGEYLIQASAIPAPSAETKGLVLLAPFQDRRYNREIHMGRAEYENVTIDAVGRTQMAGTWAKLRRGDLSLLWHSTLAAELQGAGWSVSALAEPMDDGAVLAAAKASGAQYILDGQIKKLSINPRGSDFLIGTNISGTDYHFVSLDEVRLRDASTGAVLKQKPVEFRNSYHNEVRLGADPRETYPLYFASSLPLAAHELAADPELRTALSLPLLQPTPTPGNTPVSMKPTEVPAAVAPTATVTPDASPYWVNPKTGKKVDPSWNFDPEDGTPRSKFILKQR